MKRTPWTSWNGASGAPEPLSRPNGAQPESPEQRSGYEAAPARDGRPNGP